MDEYFVSPNIWIWMFVFWVIIIWDAAWRGLALWKSARKDQTAWFVCLFVFNTVGILPIIYLLVNRKK